MHIYIHWVSTAETIPDGATEGWSPLCTKAPTPDLLNKVILSSNMETYKPEKHDGDPLSRQTTTAEGHLEKKFSKLTMTGMAFAILK